MSFWRATGPRLVALLVAAVVSADVTLDAACDPLRLPGPASAAAFCPDKESRDACAETCVADCFCCSRSETAGPALDLPGLTASAHAPSPAPVAVSAVARPVPEPPPLSIS